MDDEINNDPEFLATAILLNIDRRDALTERAREYRVMRDHDSTIHFRKQAMEASARIRELKRRQRANDFNHKGK